MHFNMKSKGCSAVRCAIRMDHATKTVVFGKVYTDAKSYHAQFTKRYAPNGDRERVRRLANQARKIVAA